MFLEEVPHTSSNPRVHRVLTALHLSDFKSSESRYSAGELLGLLVGVKSAVLFLSEEPDACAAWARAIAPLGFDLVVEGHLIADPCQLVARVEQEPTFAASAGWDTRLTVQENIHQFLTKETVDASDGFLLGYPACAVRQMDRYYNLARRNIVGIGMFDETELSNPEDQQVCRAFLERLIRLDASEEDVDRVLTEIYASEECHALYRRHFPNATADDYDILANGRKCVIHGPWGTEVYSFAIHAADLDRADHRALHACVREGFTRHGFGPFL